MSVALACRETFAQTIGDGRVVSARVGRGLWGKTARCEPQCRTGIAPVLSKKLARLADVGGFRVGMKNRDAADCKQAAKFACFE